jgi:hypothetical protein
VLGPPTEDTVERCLADEGDCAGRERDRQLLEALACAGEVRGAQLARAAGRPARGIREPDPVPEQLDLLMGLQ